MLVLALAPAALAVTLRRTFARGVLATGLAFSRAGNSQYVALGF